MHSAPLFCYARHLAPSDQQLLHSLSRTPFVDSTELAGILGEPHATVHRALTNLLADGSVVRVSNGTGGLCGSQGVIRAVLLAPISGPPTEKFAVRYALAHQT